jgi:hypothetical protein
MSVDEGIKPALRAAEEGEELSPEQVLDMFRRLEEKRDYHKQEADRIDKVLADLKDTINGRSRKPRTGRFGRKSRAKKETQPALPVDAAAVNE